MKSTVYIALGSNVGHRLHYLREAVLKLREIIEDLRTSIVIETEALLPENAPTSWNLPYLNMVVAGETTLSPQELMRKLQAIEQQLGREKAHPFWGPRTMDLDILL
ncbi:MAG: 2-amino-4-hydroxy-6-hydroxymethyldihydropteridine diphosphokinase, partial [bacterium]